MNTQVITLLKLVKQVADHHKKIKSLTGNLEELEMRRQGDVESQNITNFKFDKTFKEMDNELRQSQV